LCVLLASPTSPGLNHFADKMSKAEALNAEIACILNRLPTKACQALRQEPRPPATCVANRSKEQKPPNEEKREIAVDLSDRLIETRLQRHSYRPIARGLQHHTIAAICCRLMPGVPGIFTVWGAVCLAREENAEGRVATPHSRR
jgi:hypothetical protein